jgi:hypothetical protein
MKRYYSKSFTPLHHNLSGYDNPREFPSGLKARRAFTKMATNCSVAIFNHRYKGNRRSFPGLKIDNLSQSVTLPND